MTTLQTIAPVHKSITVLAPPAHAFHVFTMRMVKWWPLTHSINPTKSPIRDIVVEPRVGGRWYEIGEDGSQCDWGKVLVWNAPQNVLLQWQVDQNWTHNPAVQTEIDIRFTAEGAGTRVDLEHRLLENYGEHAQKMREILGSPGGWSGMLDSFAAKAAN